MLGPFFLTPGHYLNILGRGLSGLLGDAALCNKPNIKALCLVVFRHEDLFMFSVYKHNM